MKNLISLLCFMALTIKSSDSLASKYDFYLGLGNLSQFTSQIQTDNQGQTKFFSLKPTFNAGASYEFYRGFVLQPEFILTLPEEGRDTNISKWQYFAMVSGGYKFQDWTFRLGMGFAMQRISADGGTQTLNNGTSTTDFPLPETPSVSQNLITSLGVQYSFLDNWSARLEAFIYNPEDGDERSLSHTATVIYHFGDLFEYEGDYRKTQKKRKKYRRKRKKKSTKRSSN